VRVVVIRHGPAGDREQWEAEGRDDRLRPLTPEGRKEMRAAAVGLARLVPAIDVLAASPFTRAAESAEIVSSIYRSKIMTVDSLAPGHKPEEVVGWLRDQRQAQTVGLVGHEPDLSTLVGFLLTERPASFIDLKKGGACLLDLKDPHGPGGATLEWLLTRRELKRLGDEG
jgi:phosphohistidine phosphatase